MSIQDWLRAWFSDPENALLTGLFILLVLLAMALVSRSRVLKAQLEAAYEPQRELFSEAERKLLEELEEMLGEPWRVFGKMPLAELVCLCPGLGKKSRRRATEKLRGQVADFIVCDRKTLDVAAVVLAVPQADSGMSSMREVLDIAQIPVIAGGDPEQVREALNQALGLSVVEGESGAENEGHPGWQLGRLEAAPAEPEEEWQLGDANGSAAEIASDPVQPAGPTCGSCGAAMRRRRVTKGTHSGKLFWVCTDYPRCRRLLKIPEA